jgi:excisionase family DNA binding protein
MAPTEPKLIGATRAAEILGISRRTVSKYAVTGAIPIYSTTPGGNYRFRESDIVRIAERLKRKGAKRGN